MTSTTDNKQNMKEGKTTLSTAKRLSYGVGHVLNDLCASIWFTYSLIFFNKVLRFSSSRSGTLVLVGQIADALSTPFIGYFSDRGGDAWFCRYGKRKTWHLVGTILIILSMPFIYSPCIDCENSAKWIQMIYYTFFIVIFQFSWASCQISHLSLVPDLTPNEHERTTLLAIRYSFTVIATLVVYLLLWAVLQTGGGASDEALTPNDSGKFQILAYSVIAIGTVTCIIFHVGTKENSQKSFFSKSDVGTHNKRVTGGSPLGLFTKIRLYQVAVLYMATRLFANISQTIFPLYLYDDLGLGGQSIAVLPLVMYAFSFLMTMVIKPLNKKFGRKIAFCFGAFVGIGVSIWISFGCGYLYKTYFIYVIAGLYGISSSALLVTSLGMTADLIGQDLNNGAFIYGLMSFCDKLSNGIVIMAIESWMCVPSCYMHYRDSLAIVCGGSALLGFIAVMTLCNKPPPDSDKLKAEDGESMHEDAISNIEVAVTMRHGRPSLTL